MAQLRIRLKFKIILATVAVTAVTATLIAIKGYVNTRDREYDMAARTMALEAAIYGQRISEAFEGMARDATILANLVWDPRLLGSRAQPAGTGAADSGPGSEGVAHLQSIFAHFIEARPVYTQVRFISKTGNWMELVRINQDANGVTIVPGVDLQAKGDEGYMAAADRPDRSAGYFSEVTYNREYGQISGRPVIRFILPVKTATGAVSGAIVLNADFERLLQASAPGVGAGLRVTLMTQNLDYMVFLPQADSARFLFHRDSDWARPALADLVDGFEGQPALYRNGDDIVHLHAVNIPSEPDGSRMYISTDIPEQALLAEAASNLRETVALSLGMLLLAGSAIYAISKRLTAPLEALNQAIARRRDLSDPIEFQPQGRDEVSELATEFAEMANQLAEETRWLTAVLEGAADGMMIVSRDGMIQQVNPAAARIFGHSIDDLVGRALADVVPEGFLDVSFQDKAPAAASENTVLDIREGIGRRADGSQVPIEVSLARGRIAGEVHFIANIRNITHRKEAEQQMNALIAALERSNAELDQFTYVASHDLKAPLRVIQNATDWLVEDLEPHLTDDTRESLELLQSRASRMERLLNDLLQHSRIGRAATPSAIIPGATFTSEILAMLDIPSSANVTFSDSFRDISVRRMPLQTVLTHLVGNAVKHHDRPVANVAVDLEDTPEAYLIAVTDDGPGIPEEYHEKIFEIFQTLKPRDVVDTSGMGLAFVKKYITVIGGRIEVDSNGSRGTTFRLWWPKENSRELAA